MIYPDIVPIDVIPQIVKVLEPTIVNFHSILRIYMGKNLRLTRGNVHVPVHAFHLIRVLHKIMMVILGKRDEIQKLKKPIIIKIRDISLT